MRDSPYITVIIPIFNAQTTLRRCLDSLRVQDMVNIEFLLINDGSSDSSQSVCEEYAAADSRFTCFYQENGGVSSARNTGLRHARGEYICFLDADDYCEPNLCSRLYSVARGGADLVICGYYYYRIGGTVHNTQPGATFADWRADADIVLNLYYNHMLNAVWNKLYRKDKLYAAFDNGLSLGEDLLLNLDYLTGCHKVCVVSDLLVHYFEGTHNTTLATSFRRDIMETFLFLNRKMEDFLAAHFDSYNTALLYRIFAAYFRSGAGRLVYSATLSKKEKRAILEEWLSREEILSKLQKADAGTFIEKAFQMVIRTRSPGLLYRALRVRKYVAYIRQRRRHIVR